MALLVRQEFYDFGIDLLLNGAYLREGFAQDGIQFGSMVLEHGANLRLLSVTQIQLTKPKSEFSRWLGHFVASRVEPHESITRAAGDGSRGKHG
jgi:hypothetical protein